MSVGKYQSLPLAKKIEIIREVELGEISKSDIAKKHNLPLSTLSTFLKNKADLEEKYSNIDANKKRKRVKKPGFPEVDEAVTLWFSEARSRNINLDGSIIKAKAVDFAKSLDKSEFKASNGWFNRWKDRNDIIFQNLCDESASVNLESAE